MANQKRLSDNANGSKLGRRGVPRKGAALLQGIAVCGQCGHRMSLRHSGPDYPIYCCRADKDQTATPLCQEVRALPVDDLVAQTLLEALAPDQIKIAIATRLGSQVNAGLSASVAGRLGVIPSRF